MTTTATAASLLLSPTQRQAYDDQGFLVVRRVFTPDEIAAALAEADRLFKRQDLIDMRNLRCRWQPHCDDGECLFETFDPVIDIAPVCAQLARHSRLFAILGEAFAQQPWSHWQSRMRAAGVPCGQVRTVGEAIRSLEATERTIVTRIPHATVGWVQNVRSPIRYSRTPITDPIAAPAVGQHTQQVLSELLGYDGGRLTRLAESGVLGVPYGRPEQAERRQ